MSIVISVENVSKQYRLGEVGTGSLAHDVNRWWHRVRGKEDPYLQVGDTNDRSSKGSSDYAWALKDVSFEVKQGEVLGIIGRNGAGKSTLLKILSRVTRPTTGEIRVKGRIASLLEVGTGFHPELTGRENIFLNGAILGMRKWEIYRKFDEIVEFSGCERYIDTPVKRYSSGMYVRLAFAVAAHLQPEILIVDEVLAVGDAEFQKKCLGKMKDVAGEGRTVLFVSHNMGAVRGLCTRVVWAENGRIKASGAPDETIDQYLTGANFRELRKYDINPITRQSENGKRIRIKGMKWTSEFPLRHGNPATASISLDVLQPVTAVSVGLGFSTIEGTRLITYETDYQDADRPDLRTNGALELHVRIESLPLAPGLYSMDAGCRSGDFHSLDYVPSFAQIEVLPGKQTPPHIERSSAGVRLPSKWHWIEGNALIQSPE